jgi:hypothetical protein
MPMRRNLGRINLTEKGSKYLARQLSMRKRNYSKSLRKL